MTKILLLFSLLSFQLIVGQIKLTHNIGNTPVPTDMGSCEYDQFWNRAFKLSDFGIGDNEKFVINSGQVAIYNSGGASSIQFSIFKIDGNFPNSYSTSDLLGKSQIVQLPVIGNTPETITVDFDSSIIISETVDQILVEVRKFSDINQPQESIAYIAGTQEDNDLSWYRGCDVYLYTSTENLNPPAPDANFFINVTGEILSTSNLGFDTTLTHNSCEEIIKVNQYSCSWGGLKYGRTFVLQDFGISDNEDFVIDRGQVALSGVGVYDVKLQFNIYKIDDNFPISFSENDLIGSSQ